MQNQPSWFQTILQSYSQFCVLVQKQKYGPMKQYRRPREKPTKEARLSNGEKTASSISGAGKAGQLHVKEWNLNTSNTINKNKFKMD